MIVKKGINIVQCFAALILFSTLLSSCFFMEPKVKKYPEGIPFVYKNVFTVKTDSLSKSEKAALKSRIAAQIDDSMIARVLDRAVFQGVIKNPPQFDTFSMLKSVRNIKLLMNNLGYYRAEVSASYNIDSSKKYTSKGQYRVTTIFNVDTKKNTLIDSLNYILPTKDLQRITTDNLENAFLKKGKPFTVEKVSAEISRMLADYRNNGYYNINRSDIYADVDTVNKALLNPDLSDFERIILLARSKNKRPMINVLMKMRPKIDSVKPPIYDTAKLKRYFIGSINVYPSYNFLLDSTFNYQTYSRDSNILLLYNTYKFKPSYLASNIFLKQGELYKEADYIRTINNINLLGSWQVVNVQSYIDSAYQDSVGRVNFNFYLTPVKRYSFSANVESSFSTNVTAATGQGNILGFLGNVSLTDRNVAKEGIKATLSLRGGVEYNLSQRGIQNSRELGLTNSYVFPKFIKVIPVVNFFILGKKKPMIYKSTNLSGNISSLNRVGFFNLASFTIGAGYDWKEKINLTRTAKLNIDYTNLYNETDEFRNAIKDNPFLKNSFQTSLVMGLSTTYLFNLPSKKPNIVHTLKINAEESGVLFGKIKRMFKDESVLKNLREYVKADVEYKRSINFQKSALALRVFIGAGTPIRADSGLPFFKQYFAGGPNSMRAWPIRSLGLGGAAFPKYQPGNTKFNDRVGDVQLEANIEYRYDIAPLFNNVLNLKGAVFMDAGNVWAIKKDKTITGYDPKLFQLKNIYKQLAVGLGTGFRLDFNYFLLRFDFGFRFKRPDVEKNDGWQIPSINIKNVFGKNGREWRYDNYNFTFGINYAF